MEIFIYKNQLLPSECREMMETVNVFGDKASVYHHWTPLGDLNSSALEFNSSENHWLCKLGEILSKTYHHVAPIQNLLFELVQLKWKRSILVFFNHSD